MNLLDRFLPKTKFDDYDDFNENFKINVPENFNFAYDVVDEYARICPDKRAIVWVNDRDEERTFTFGELKRLTDKAANFLLSIGIQKGDFVMSMLKSRYQYWILINAVHKVGGIFVPATHLLTVKDIVYRVQSAQIKLLVCAESDDIQKNVLEAQKECPSLKHVATIGEDRKGFLNFDKELEKADDKLKRIEVRSTDDMIMYFTSGTTGYPKMVKHDFTYPLGHIITSKYWLQCEDEGLHYTVSDTGWGKASWGKLYGQWISGTTVFIYDYDGKFEAVHLLPLIDKYDVTTFCAPPTIYRFLIKEDLSHCKFSHLHHLCTAGEPLNPEVYKKMLEITGLKIHEAFGQTETVCLLATIKGMDIKVGSMGKPTPIYDVHILDAAGNEVQRGEDGEICIKVKPGQIGLFSGYHNDPERMKETIVNGYYHTGDLAYMDEDGYFWFVGRKDDIIKSSGYRIGPFEVESAVMEHPAVLECAITGVPDDLRGQVVKATIVLAKGYEPSEELKKDIQNYVKHATAPYKYPRIVEFVNDLPKTISGKIRRVEIREKKSR